MTLMFQTLRRKMRKWRRRSKAKKMELPKKYVSSGCDAHRMTLPGDFRG